MMPSKSEEAVRQEEMAQNVGTYALDYYAMPSSV